MTSNALNVSRITELGLLCLAAATITLANVHRRFTFSFASSAPIVSSLFVLWATLSCLWSINPILSFARGMTLMLLLYTAIALATFVRNFSANSVRALLIIMTAGLLGSILILMLSDWIFWGTPLKFSAINEWSGRSGRLFFAYAVPLETGGLIGVAMTVAVFGIQRRLARIAVVGALFALLLMTDSRNLIAIVPFAIVLGLFQQGSNQLRFMMAVAVICSLIALAFFAVSGGLTDLIPRDIWTLNGRTPLWQRAAGIVADNPFLGVGYYASRFFLAESAFHAGNTHNAYVDILLTTGMVGLTLFITFLAYCLKVAIEARSSVLTSMLVLCCLGSIFNVLILVTNTYTFYLLVTLIVVAEDSARRRKEAIARALFSNPAV